ncbi:hypothetical protein [Phenylobacterium aquaticum]|uniref:hypothetical protein n=1 Tax=Phenylobacterium aquaticum TaxID=1763816 RepID=UPI001F5D0959|nr:hypothetical protein [Phenylobacterium aquaticum]MCI3134006.1 hypothetical protein [Phenylobacterium aquaticum]
MPEKKLAVALQAVDWNANISDFLAEKVDVQVVAEINLRLAMWARQIEGADSGNPALSFIRELQVASQQVTVLLGLALYKSAAASMRTVFESALYYTYFRTHPSELATLVRDSGYFLGRRDITDYHKLHTANFSNLQSALGLGARSDKWYSYISAIIHGQIPGSWVSSTAVKDIRKHPATLAVAIEAFAECEEVVRRLFLCTCAHPFWHAFSTTSKETFLKNLTGQQKTALGLDQA